MARQLFAELLERLAAAVVKNSPEEQRGLPPGERYADGMGSHQRCPISSPMNVAIVCTDFE
jgi:hypothetical protein